MATPILSPASSSLWQKKRQSDKSVPNMPNDCTYLTALYARLSQLSLWLAPL